MDTARANALNAKRFLFIVQHCLQNDWGNGKVVLRWSAPLGGGGSLEATQYMEQTAFIEHIDKLMQEKEDNEQRKRSAAP